MADVLCCVQWNPEHYCISMGRDVRLGLMAIVPGLGPWPTSWHMLSPAPATALSHTLEAHILPLCAARHPRCTGQ
jgi:hypothetical protein